MSQGKEHKTEKVHRKYGVLWLALSRVFILALFVLAVAAARYYRPLYETVDVVILVAAGALLGAVFVQSAGLWEKSYRQDLAEAAEKSACNKPNSRQEIENHDARPEETHG